MLKEFESRARTWTRLCLRRGICLSRQIALILPDIHVVKLGGVTSQLLDFLGDFSAGIAPVAWKELKMVLKLHSSTLYRLARPSIISQWA